MFFEGGIQTGISKALQEKKAVVCFVRDEGKQSEEWETAMRSSAELKQNLAENSVLLNMLAGSHEAAMLSQFCKIESFPSVAVINNGALVKHITAAISTEEFLRELSRVIISKGNHDEVLHDPEPQSNDEDKGASSPADAKSRTASHETRNQHLKSHNTTMQEAKRERERILKQIQYDKMERKLKAERTESMTEQSTVASTESSCDTSNSGYRSVQECAIQIRLLDGSVLRSRFPSSESLRASVRPWIDSQRNDGDSPYTFRQMLAPYPNRSISISEEEESLLELKLTPSATLIMVRVEGVPVNAYEPQSNVLKQGLSSGYNFLSVGANLIVSSLGAAYESISGTINSTSSNESTIGVDASNQSQPVNVHTLNSTASDRSNQNEFYNGNQLSFQPRNKKKSEEEE